MNTTQCWGGGRRAVGPKEKFKRLKWATCSPEGLYSTAVRPPEEIKPWDEQSKSEEELRDSVNVNGTHSRRLLWNTKPSCESWPLPFFLHRQNGFVIWFASAFLWWRYRLNIFPHILYLRKNKTELLWNVMVKYVQYGSTVPCIKILVLNYRWVRLLTPEFKKYHVHNGH